MKIIHHIGLSPTDQAKAAFAKAGVQLKSGLISGFDISEDDPRWEMVAKLAAQFRAVNMSRTEFSSSELDAAAYLDVLPSWHYGYPEPSDDGGYLRATFDLEHGCEKCGTGMKQKAPFRMKKPPVWGRRSMLQLNWIFDEYFVTPDAWAAVFKPLGIDARPVVLNKTGEVIASAVQLEIPNLVDLLGLETQPYLVCACCGRKKYHPVVRGFSPAPAKTDAMIFKSTQYFGSGASAFRKVFISSTLYRRIKEASLKGVTFLACAGS